MQDDSVPEGTKAPQDCHRRPDAVRAADQLAQRTRDLHAVAEDPEPAAAAAPVREHCGLQDDRGHGDVCSLSPVVGRNGHSWCEASTACHQA